MLRFIFKQQIVDANIGMNNETIHSVVVNVPIVEGLLCRGGSGEMGFDHTSLLGIEIVKDARQENIEAQPQPKTAEVAIALMNRLDELVKRGRHILVAEDILLKAVNEWRSATDNHS
jgi:hypothetical protein